jgi:hypothetical protein
MHHLPQKRSSAFIMICVCLLITMLSISTFIQAQDATATPQGAPIEISGPIAAVGTGTVTISGLTVDVSGITNVTLTPGSVITVTGYMSPTNIIVAQTVVINIVSATLTPTPATPVAATATGTLSATPAVTGTLSATPAVTATATPSSNVIIVIEGPVINIVNNFITIYDFDIEVEANHPILNLIQIGDLVRIEGAYGSGSVIVATVVSNLSDMQLVNGATVSLEGPVESINGNIIVVNGIAVQLAANDPLLQTVQIGQFVSVQGNFQNNGTTIVLVVVTIVINTNTNTGGGGGGNGNCEWKENGMSGMGKWKCKGSKKGS